MQKEVKPDKNNKFQLSRIGFEADVIVYVVGTSFEGRQKHLAKIYDACSPEDTPRCYLKRDKDNKYDKNAVAVYVTLGNTDIQIGFLPKEYEIPCRSTTGAFHYDNNAEPITRPVWKIMDHDYGVIKVGLEGVWEQHSNYGARVGIAHELTVAVK